MVRTDGGGSDVTESIGATNLDVVWSRAQEKDTDCPLFTDAYAQVFVDAAVDSGWQLPPDLTLRRIEAIGGYVASRTKWFDELFIAAGANGIDQAVILAAGLDARAWRLPWVGGSVVYEVEQPKVLAFKAETLRRHGATPAARYVPVPVGLDDDWPDSLCRAGFDPSEPTAWAAEGLLPLLPAEEQQRLFERIHDLSARGSRMGAEAVGGGEPRTLAADWLTGHGWEVTAIAAADLMSRYGRCAAGEADDTTPRTVFVEGRLLT